MRFDPSILEAAKAKAKDDHRSLTNYVELLMKKDLKGESETELTVFAPNDIRNAVPLRFEDEDDEHVARREAIHTAILDASGH